MYELVQVSENCYYIDCPAKIGIVKTDPGEVCLIDSGNDKSTGKKVRRILDENGWTLKAIYNTHSHADHIGGNHYLQTQTGCAVYAYGIERAFTEFPLLEPFCLYGATPPSELKHKFFLAQSSEVRPMTEECMPEGMTIIDLPGHGGDMVGFRTADDIVYLADCLASRETLDKYGITFLIDVGDYLDTLEKVKTMEAKLFIPAHAEVTDDIAPLAQYNIERVRETADAIVSICAEPSSFETILKKLFEKYDLRMSVEQFALIGSTTRSYMTWLREQGQLSIEISDNTLFWQAV